MRRDAARGDRLMRVGELAEATGVSVQTIHFYLREGLLARPIKTSPNMAYYGPEFVEEIRLIKELQEKRYLPLSLIRLVLEAKRQGQEVGHLQEMRLSLEELFRPRGPEEKMEPVSTVELVAMTGLSLQALADLEQISLLMPSPAPEDKRYDGLDLHIARSAKKLLDLGLAPSDLSFYSQYVEALRSESRVMHDKVMHNHTAGMPPIPLKELKEL
ncbi:MAG TPA: MerR family transcriptional regulator, partial [Chloroflexota bacterium]|nr:MerR family transcriptional regulator [Chloroflexota bacterium]